MAGNKRGEGDSTLSRISPISLSVHRHQFCVPSTRARTSRAPKRAHIDRPLSAARRSPRFSFLSTAPSDLPLESFRTLPQGQNKFRREKFSLPFFLLSEKKKRRIRILKDPCVSPRRERVEKSRILEGTESRMGTSDSRRESVYPSNWSNFQRSRFHCNPILPIFSSPLILITDLTTQKKDHRSDSSHCCLYSPSLVFGYFSLGDGTSISRVSTCVLILTVVVEGIFSSWKIFVENYAAIVIALARARPSPP